MVLPHTLCEGWLQIASERVTVRLTREDDWRPSGTYRRAASPRCISITDSVTFSDG